MARRRSITVTCTQGTCREYTFYEYSNQAEAAEIRKRAAAWKCSRHADADQVLTPDSRERVSVLVATTLYGKPDWRTGETRPLGRFWLPEGSSTGSGYAAGPGYKAHANDFPEGTRLVVAARIELPETSERAEEKIDPDVGGNRRRWVVHVPDGYSIINPQHHPIEVTVIDEPKEAHR